MPFKKLTKQIVACLMIVALVSVTLQLHAKEPDVEIEAHKALAKLIVDHIDSVLNSVAQSTRAVATEFVIAHRAVASGTDGRAPVQLPPQLTAGQTVLFQTWPGALQPAPGFQAVYPGFYSYSGQPVSDDVGFQLKVFRLLTPAVRSAYSSFPFSWSYVTTADNMMLIYPFLTLEEAVNNQLPTAQTYYTHADFENRTAGWTPPYLDLVGAGMMVTASTPAYDGDTLLGVVSHDVTLDELSKSVLMLMTRDVGGTAWLVDATGLVIGVSDSDLESEMDRVNRAAGKAVLHYRLAQTSGEGATSVPVPKDMQQSQSAWVNRVTEKVRSQSATAHQGEVIDFSATEGRVLAVKSGVTGWLLVWVRVKGQSKGSE